MQLYLYNTTGASGSSNVYFFNQDVVSYQISDEI